MTDRKPFSPETRAELRKVLAKQSQERIGAIIEALEIGAGNWRTHERVHREDNEEDRLIRAWARGLSRHLEAARALLKRAPDAEVLGYVRQLARWDRLLALGITAANAEAEIRTGKAGQRSRIVLNVNLAGALKYHGIPLSKGRSSLAHRIFVIVYAELGLSRQGDVFRALAQGVELVRSHHRFRETPAAQQVIDAAQQVLDSRTKQR